MADIIEIRYEELEGLRGQFLNQADMVKQILDVIEARMDALRSGGWVSEAATAFYADMEGDLLPAIQRLGSSMIEGGEAISHLKSIFEAAEEEGSGLFVR